MHTSSIRTILKSRRSSPFSVITSHAHHRFFSQTINSLLCNSSATSCSSPRTGRRDCLTITVSHSISTSASLRFSTSHYRAQREGTFQLAPTVRRWFQMQAAGRLHQYQQPSSLPPPPSNMYTYPPPLPPSEPQQQQQQQQRNSWAMRLFRLAALVFLCTMIFDANESLREHKAVEDFFSPFQYETIVGAMIAHTWWMFPSLHEITISSMEIVKQTGDVKALLDGDTIAAVTPVSLVYQKKVSSLTVQVGRYFPFVRLLPKHTEAEACIQFMVRCTESGKTGTVVVFSKWKDGFLRPTDMYVVRNEDDVALTLIRRNRKLDGEQEAHPPLFLQFEIFSTYTTNLATPFPPELVDTVAKNAHRKWSHVIDIHEDHTFTHYIHYHDEHHRNDGDNNDGDNNKGGQ